MNIVDGIRMFTPRSSRPARNCFSWCIWPRHFPHVALYFENSILTPDLPLLAAASASVDHFERDGGSITVTSKYPVGVRWTGPATVNGRVWPVHDAETVWLPE